ncbi:hypothetical protein [Frankia sp. QA3]|uniref:hypothetical protein n=1 Tax=Frankia sp. QA3 TaxID=710111 RepID=UPI000269BB9A|nr:hypothetical protein [Frankia sp. QA3]EIV91285.1 hypothetical protein FraQA3DRAFT_0721 [Frankia sp. QA3]
MVVLTRRQRRVARVAAGLLGVLLLVLVLADLDVALKVAGLIGGFGAIITVLVERPKEPAKTVDELRESLRAQIREEWRLEADQRGLLHLPLLPITLEARDALGSAGGSGSAGSSGSTGDGGARSILLPRGDVAWEPAHYRAFAAGLVRDGLLRRAIVTGTAGGGKSTFGLLLTLGLLDVDGDPSAAAAGGAGAQGWIPLLLTIASWDTHEDFAAWFDRQLRTTYPSTAALRPARDGTLLTALLAADRVLLVLDGVDEVRTSSPDVSAVRLIGAKVQDRPVLLLARDGTPGLADLHSSAVLALVRPTADQVRAYLSLLAQRRPGPATWQPVLRELRDHPQSVLAAALGTPFMVSLAYRCCADGLEPARLVELAAERGRDGLERFLIDRFLEDAMARFTSPTPARARRTVEYMAGRMVELKQEMLAWWRLQEGVPMAAFTAAVGLLAAPAYRIALILPPGLTRGFAIGILLSLVFGMTRGRDMDRSAAIVGAVTSAAVVLAFGLAATTPGEALAHATQFGTALLLTLLQWNRMFESVRTVLRTAAGVALATAAATELVAFACRGDAGPTRGAHVGLSVFLGVAVAVAVARSMTEPAAPMTPARVDLRRWEGRPPIWRFLLTGVAACMLVGTAGGFVGGVRDGGAHGIGVAVLFSIVVGFPVGLVAGIVTWLNQPPPGGGSTAAATPRSTFRADMVIALGCVVLVGLITAGAIALVLGPLSPLIHGVDARTMHLHPWDGVWFALTVGLILASYTTAWPTFLVCAVWFTLTAGSPPRLIRYLDLLHRYEILRREGALWKFRNDYFRHRLAERGGRTERGGPSHPSGLVPGADDTPPSTPTTDRAAPQA